MGKSIVLERSILLDVLNVINKVNICKTDNIFEDSVALMEKETIDIYRNIYAAAMRCNDFIAAALYSVNGVGNIKYAVIYKFLIGKVFEISSFESLIDWFKNNGYLDFILYVLKSCLDDNQDCDMYFLMSEQEIYNDLEKTDLPDTIKYSIVKMIKDHDKFLKCLIEYMEDVYKYVALLYAKGTVTYNKMLYAMQVFIGKNGIKDLLGENDYCRLPEDKNKRKVMFIISLLLLDYRRTFQNEDGMIRILGYFDLQRQIHSKNFCIF